MPSIGVLEFIYAFDYESQTAATYWKLLQKNLFRFRTSIDRWNHRPWRRDVIYDGGSQIGILIFTEWYNDGEVRKIFNLLQVLISLRK